MALVCRSLSLVLWHGISLSLGAFDKCCTTENGLQQNPHFLRQVLECTTTTETNKKKTTGIGQSLIRKFYRTAAAAPAKKHKFLPRTCSCSWFFLSFFNVTSLSSFYFAIKKMWIYDLRACRKNDTKHVQETNWDNYVLNFFSATPPHRKDSGIWLLSQVRRQKLCCNPHTHTDVMEIWK